MAQDAVRKADLNDYLKLVKQRIAKNPDSAAWTQLEDRWLAIVEHAKAVVAAFQSGKAERVTCGRPPRRCSRSPRWPPHAT